MKYNKHNKYCKVENKRGQENLAPALYAVVAIVVILLASWGIFQFYKSKSSVSQADFIVFSKNLNNFLKTDSSQFGNIENVNLVLPEGTNNVCMIDRSEEFNEFSDSQLAVAVSAYEDMNVFVKNKGGYIPLKIENLKLSEDNNPFCIKTSGNNIKLNLENKGEHKSISISPDEEKSSEDCTVLVYSGEPSKKLDFTFVASNYNDVQDFKNDAEKYIDVLRNNEPFKSNFSKLNFYMINDIASVKCENGQLINCDKEEFEIHELASKCPNDIIILLHKNFNVISPVRSSSVSNMNMVKISSSPVEDNSVILHELGHMIGHLADEYVDNAYYQNVNFKPDPYPNCDYSPCSKWSVGGCYEGCSLGNYYRPTQDSIMRSLSDLNYGPVNEKAMNNNLGVYQ